MRRGIALTTVAFALLAGAAQASTVLHVNGASGADAGNCQAAPCKTIGYAVTQGEAVPDLVTIDVAAGNYNEDLSLGSADSGLTISGAGSGTDPSNSTIITGLGTGLGINTGGASGYASSLGLDHLRLVGPLGDTYPVIDGSGASDLSLNDVAVNSATSSVGIAASADISWSGGSLTMTNSSAGPGVSTAGSALTLSNVPVSYAGANPALVGAPISLANSPVTTTNTSGGAPAIVATGGRLTVVNSPIDVKGNGFAIDASQTTTVSNSAITLEGTAGSAPAILDSGGPGSPLSITGAPIDLKGTGSAVIDSGGGVQLSAVQIKVENATDNNPALDISGRGSSLSHVTIADAGSAPLLIDTGDLAVSDSSLTASSAITAPIVQLMSGGSYGSDVSFLRSVVRQSVSSIPNVVAEDVNLAVDSSELLGGIYGVSFDETGGASRTLTIASSTVDAGALGVRDSTPIASVFAQAAGALGSSATVNVEGSILVEPPTSLRTTPGAATVNCTNSEVPTTTQIATSSLGAINCGAANGNTFTPSLSTIFANPASGYALNPAWSGVDSVPDGAISMPVPFTDSATDVLGEPRVLNGKGGCTTGLRDRGAIELAGHSGTLPQPLISGPSTVSTSSTGRFKATAPNVHGVSVSFSWRTSDGATGTGATFAHRFKRSGKQTVTVTGTGAPGCTGTAAKRVTAVRPATISGLKISPRGLKPSGHATVSYRDSGAAATTLTIQRKSGSHYKKVRSFTHRDRGGKVTVRLNGAGLARGTYRLQAVARNAGGSGPPAFATFTIS